MGFLRNTINTLTRGFYLIFLITVTISTVVVIGTILLDNILLVLAALIGILLIIVIARILYLKRWKTNPHIEEEKIIYKF